VKIEEEEKLGEGKNPEEASIRKRQKFREEQNSEEGKNMEETKIRRSQLENQEEAKKSKNSKFQPLWARKALIEGEFIVSFAHQANHSFSGICAMLIEYCKYVQLRLDTDCNIF